MRGKCINSTDSTLLQLEKEYFLFPVGSQYFYVSNFNNKEAHFGCYKASKFQVIEQEDCTKEQKAPVDAGIVNKEELIETESGQFSLF